MSALDRLAACAGKWQGTNRLQDPNMNVEDESPAGAEVTTLLGGKFPDVDWGWRIVLKPVGGKALHLLMYNINPTPPEDVEELAVEADFTRTE